MPLRLEDLNSTQFRQLSPSQTVFLFPVSGLDDYGPHLPMGLGVRLTGQLSWQLATRIEEKCSGFTAVLLPHFNLAPDLATRVGLISRGTALKDALLDQSLKLSDQGFLHFVAVSYRAGPRTLTAIEEAGQGLRKRQTLKRIFSWVAKNKALSTLVSLESYQIPFSKVSETPFTCAPSEHGGAEETAAGLLLCPEKVDPIYSSLPKAAMPPFTYRSGYWGDPSQASTVDILKSLEDWIQARLPALESVWKGKNPESLFRSWYSVIPLNRTFFRVWVGFFVMLALMGFWIRVSVG